MGTKEALLHPKTAVVLVSLKEDGKRWYASSLARQANLSYVYVTELLNLFQSDGVVEFKREGKIKRVMLTEKGIRIATAVSELMDRIAQLETKEQKAEAKPG